MLATSDPDAISVCVIQGNHDICGLSAGNIPLVTGSFGGRSVSHSRDFDGWHNDRSPVDYASPVGRSASEKSDGDWNADFHVVRSVGCTIRTVGLLVGRQH